jgi:hypothetical protein
MDAIMSASPGNYFIEEEDLTVPQMYIGPTYPELNTGYSYAFFVQAYDPNNQVQFNNNGTSEVCWFTYKEPQSNDSTGIEINISDDFSLDTFLDDFALLPSTQVKGRLLYKLASESRITGARGNAQSMESAGKNEKWNQRNQQSSPGDTTGSYHGSSQNSGNMNMNQFSMNNYQYYMGNNFTQNINFPPPLGTGVINADLYNTNGAKPLVNMLVRLVPRIILKGGDGLPDTKDVYGSFKWPHKINLNDYRFYDILGNVIDAEKIQALIDKPVAVTTTDNNGYYQFDFQQDFFTGPFIYIYGMNGSQSPSLDNYEGYISLKVEVENEKFCSPDVDIFAVPGDNLTIPDQVALIKDYDMDVSVYVTYDFSGRKSQYDVYQTIDTLPKVLPGGSPLPGATVRILRDAQKLGNEHPAILLSEGSGEGEIIENENGRFKVVFEGTTDKDGKLHITHLVKHWEQTDGGISTAPYYISIQTRADEPTDATENSFYNFKPFFGNFYLTSPADGEWNNTRHYVNATVYETGPVEYNHYFTKPPQLISGHGLDVAKPEIKGRLMAATNLENIGLSDVMVVLYNKDDFNTDGDIILAQKILNGKDWIPDLSLAERYNVELLTYTTEAGFFRFYNLPVNVDVNHKARGPYRRLQINSRVYKRIVWPPLEDEKENKLLKPYNLVYGDLKYIKFQLEPKNLLYGEVVDEEGKSVPAYIRLLPNNPYVKTERYWEYDNWGMLHSSETFRLPVADKDNDIEVVPLSNQYFTDTLHLSSIPEDNRLHIVVKKKLHRIVIRVKDLNTQNGIEGASVIVGDSLTVGTTNDNGNVLLEFPSPGQQFTVRIFADNYAPVQKVYTIPVSPQWNMAETVFLSPDKFIAGTITEKKSHQPIKDALIYTELQNTGGQSLYIEARSDANGHYLLKGIPSNYQNIFVHVVKEGKNPSYIGLEKNLNIKDELVFVNGHLQPPKYDFELEAVDADLSEIWGFPVVVEKVSKSNGVINSVSGYLYNLPVENNLQCLNHDEKIYFDNLKVSITNGKAEPSDSYFYTQRHKVPIKLTGGFSGNLTNDNGAYAPPLMVAEKNKKAFIDGVLKLNLSSFKFAYDFHGDLFVGNDTLQSGIRVFDANTSQGSSKYYVYDLKLNGGSLKPLPVQDYKIFGFNASSDFTHSYYESGSIHIGTTLHTAIPLPNGNPAMDLRINVGSVIITRDDIILETSSSPLNFELEKWKVKTTGSWYFDKNRDAIVLTKAVIQTGLGIEASVKNLLIRPNALREGEFDLGQGLSLGGVIPLTIAPGLKPVFNYDAGVGHYRISIAGTTDKPTAWIDKLPAMEGKLEFSSVDMLSNNTTEMSLGRTYRFQHLIDVFVDQIMSGDGFFSLTGMPETGIPKMVSGQALMTYYKENGQVKFKMEPLNAAVDCNANVVYNLDHETGKQVLKDRLFTSYGEFVIKPPGDESGDPIKIKGKLVRKPNETYIDVLEQDVNFGKETMHITEGKITATTNAWNELHYKAYTRSEGLADNNEMDYVVHGGIEANGDKIEVDNINTPFGDFEMAYLFPESALVGHLSINTPISTGYATIKSGLMEMRFDPKGFYFGIAASMTITAVPVEGGLVVGCYNASMRDANASIFAKMRKEPVTMNSFAGFFFMGEAPLVDASFTLAGVIDVSVKGGVGAYAGVNFANDNEVIGGGYGYLDAKGGVNITGCGFVGVKSNTWLNIEMKYQGGHVSLCGCGTSKYTVEACGLSGSLGVRAKYHLGYGGNDCSISMNGSCPSQLCQ